MALQNLMFVILGFGLHLVQFFFSLGYFLLPLLFRIEIFTFWHCVLVNGKNLKEKIFYRVLQESLDFREDFDAGLSNNIRIEYGNSWVQCWGGRK